MKTYDLVVIGSGTAAQVASARVRAAGWSVAVIDHRPFGGTCALRGCDPKKVLVAGAEAVDWARRMRGRGVAGELRIDWPELIAFKRGFTDPVPAKQERRYADQASMPSMDWPGSSIAIRSRLGTMRSKRGMS
jgi:glutathione reductase (NADPH)